MIWRTDRTRPKKARMIGENTNNEACSLRGLLLHMKHFSYDFHHVPPLDSDKRPKFTHQAALVRKSRRTPDPQVSRLTNVT